MVNVIWKFFQGLNVWQRRLFIGALLPLLVPAEVLIALMLALNTFVKALAVFAVSFFEHFGETATAYRIMLEREPWWERRRKLKEEMNQYWNRR